MITGTHILLYSADAAADRAFFRDVLKFDFVDAGEEWLIFALPPSELAVHPGETKPRGMAGAELYLMCDDLVETMESLKTKGVNCTGVVEAGWGSKTSIRLPSGAEIGFYQPRHETAIGDSKKPERKRKKQLRRGKIH